MRLYQPKPGKGARPQNARLTFRNRAIKNVTPDTDDISTIKPTTQCMFLDLNLGKATKISEALNKGQKFYHATSKYNALSIIQNGIQTNKYRGFYTSLNEADAIAWGKQTDGNETQHQVNAKFVKRAGMNKYEQNLIKNYLTVMEFTLTSDATGQDGGLPIKQDFTTWSSVYGKEVSWSPEGATKLKLTNIREIKDKVFD